VFLFVFLFYERYFPEFMEMKHQELLTSTPMKNANITDDMLERLGYAH